SSPTVAMRIEHKYRLGMEGHDALDNLCHSFGVVAARPGRPRWRCVDSLAAGRRRSRIDHQPVERSPHGGLSKQVNLTLGSADAQARFIRQPAHQPFFYSAPSPAWAY